MATKPSPSRNVTLNQASVRQRCPVAIATLAKPKVALLASSSTVSAKVFERRNNVCPPGPSAVLCDITTKVANSNAKMIASLIR
jgi:hypothetical protein